jgi:hypothetical protein
VTTRAGLRALIRGELGDQGAATTWLDAQLNQWLVEGIRDYSRRLPKPSTTTLASVADQADYALPSDCLSVARVEHPAGFFRVPDPRAGGDLIDPLSLSSSQVPRVLVEQLGYDIWGAYGSLILTLQPAPSAGSEEIKVRYLASWGEPANDVATLAVPTVDEQLIIWFVAARALEWLGTEEAKRQRFEQQRGASPEVMVRTYRGNYERALSGREGMPRRRLVIRG